MRQKGIFKYKCICDWSKDDKYGFISNTACPVHGKNVKKLIKKSVPYKANWLKEHPVHKCRRCKKSFIPDEDRKVGTGYVIKRVCKECRKVKVK